MSARLLIVDDDPDVAETMAEVLGAAGYQTRSTSRGQDALREIESGAYQLVLVDLRLPDMDGLDLIKRLDRRHNLGVIIVSGRSAGIDRVLGLELGADDYVTKPFDPRELTARVRSLLRRCSRDDVPAAGRRLRFGEWVLDQVQRQLERPGHPPVPLTPNEFRVLSVFVQAPGRVLSREFILDRLYEHEADVPFDRSIDVTITRLRRKLGEDPAHPAILRTIRGEGYLFEPIPAPA